MKNYILPLAIFLQACANIIPPTGGEIDKQAPQIRESYPKHEETNFKGNTIWIEFDEWIQVGDASKITLSPKPNEDPIIKAIKNRLTIVFPSPLDDSTTYQLNLNNGISDVTERTPYLGKSIAFSTGEILDSLHIQVASTQTDLPGYQKNVTYILKREGTAYKSKSTETQTNFNYLTEAEYTLVAFVDKNNNKIPSNKEFQDSLVFYLKTDTIITFNLQYKDTTELKLRKSRYQKGVYTYEFNKGIRVTDSCLCKLNKTANILTAYPSTKINTITDSTGHTYTLQLKDSFPDKLAIQSPVISIAGHTYNTITYRLEFNQPIESVTINNKPINKPGFYFYETIKIQGDSQLIGIEKIKPMMAEESIDTVMQMVRRDKPNAYGSVSGSVSIPNATVQIVNQNQEIIRQTVAQPNFTFSGLTAGIYLLRYYMDTNENGLADIFTTESKEAYTYYKEPITIRQNWDIENIKF